MIPDTLLRIASLNHASLSSDHFELDALFTMPLVEMKPDLYKEILQGYQVDHFLYPTAGKIDDNLALGEDAAILLFVRGRHLPALETDLYFIPRLDGGSKAQLSVPPLPTSTHDLIFHVDTIAGTHSLCIQPNIVKDILAIAHDTSGHPGFQRG